MGRRHEARKKKRRTERKHREATEKKDARKKAASHVPSPGSHGHLQRHRKQRQYFREERHYSRTRTRLSLGSYRSARPDRQRCTPHRPHPSQAQAPLRKTRPGGSQYQNRSPSTRRPTRGKQKPRCPKTDGRGAVSPANPAWMYPRCSPVAAACTARAFGSTTFSGSRTSCKATPSRVASVQ